MKRSLTFWLMPWLAISTSAFGTTSMDATAAALCNAYYGVISRSGPVDGAVATNRATAQWALAQVKLAVELERAGARAGGPFLDGPNKINFPVEHRPDGFHWTFQTGRAGDEVVRRADAYYEALLQKLDRALLIAHGGAHPQPPLPDGSPPPPPAPRKPGPTVDRVTSVSHLTSPTNIRRVLEESDYVVGSLPVNRRQVVGAIGGLLLGASVPFGRDRIETHRIRQVEREIVREARKTIVGTREAHLALVRELLGDERTAPKREENGKKSERDRTPEDTKMAAIEDHIKWLDAQDKLGTPPKFGSRRHEYITLLASHYSSEWSRVLNNLASADPDHVSIERLAGAKLGYRNSDKDVGKFTDDEVKRHRQVTEEQSGTFYAMAEGGVALATTGSLGYLLGTRWRRLLGKDDDRSTGGPLATLAPLRKAFDESQKRGTARGVLWIGSATFDGRHTDLILIYDNSGPNKTMNLVGIEYQTPIDYWTPTQAREAHVAVADTLKLMHEHLVAARFTMHFGAKVEPIDRVFALAQSMKLNPNELRLFELEVAKVRKNNFEDIDHLERMLRSLRRSSP